MGAGGNMFDVVLLMTVLGLMGDIDEIFCDTKGMADDENLWVAK
jgi:hypothetical protein